MQASQGSPVFQFLCILVNKLSKGTIWTLLRMTDIIIVFCTHAFRFHNIYILYLTNTSCIIYHYMFGLRKYIGSLKFIYIRQVAADFSAFHHCVIHLRNQINKWNTSSLPWNWKRKKICIERKEWTSEMWKEKPQGSKSRSKIQFIPDNDI